MFKLGEKPIAYDRAFTDPKTGIQYPANWLRLASLSDKQAIGVVEVADAPSYDQRFYWGAGNPKQLDDSTDENGAVTTGLKTVWSNKQNEIAALLLAPSDWRVIKAKETGTNIPTAWKTYRAAVRTSCNARQTEAAAVTTVEELKELFFGAATVTRQKTDSEGKGLVEPDTVEQQKKDESGNPVVDEGGNAVMEDVANPVAGNPIMETVSNPALATAWPDAIS